MHLEWRPPRPSRALGWWNGFDDPDYDPETGDEHTTTWLTTFSNTNFDRIGSCRHGGWDSLSFEPASYGC